MKTNQNPEPNKPEVLSIYWDQRPLNVLTIILLLAAPFWMASLILRGLGWLIPLFLIMILLVIIYAFIDKIAIVYDPKIKGFLVPNEPILYLTDIERIELDGRDLYFIPRRRYQSGLHLKARAWVIAPYKQILKEARNHNWPLYDLTRPFSRVLVWFLP